MKRLYRRHRRKARPGYSWHHLIPVSRGGTDDEENLKEIPTKVHEAWHTLFKNWTPTEVIAFLLSDDFQFDPDNGKWKAWKIVFGANCGRLEAAQIVMNEWSP